MAPSPICTVNGSSTAGGVDVAAGAALTIQLVDLSARSWALEVAGVDDSQSMPGIALTVDPVTRSATATAPGISTATIMRSTVTDGQGKRYSATFAVYVPTSGGRRVIALGETTEGDATHGWVSQLNTAIRGAGSVKTYTVTTDAVLSAEYADADLLTLAGTPGATKQLTFPMSTRDGALVTVYNVTDAAQNIWDHDGGTYALPIGELLVMQRAGSQLLPVAWSDVVLPSTLSATIDSVFGSTRGAILYRGASGWAKLSAPGAGPTKTLKHDGTGGDPYWG